MTDINVIQTSDGYAKIRLHDFEALQAEAERLREEVRELKREKLRIFKAFCCADSTLRIHYAVDMRSEADQQEAKILRAYIAGDAP
ncbi:MAG: hypothetical protein AABZ00_05015 [Chloroflexota bacterium]